MELVEYLKKATTHISNARISLSPDYNPSSDIYTQDNTLNKENEALVTFMNHYDEFDAARQGDLSKADGRVTVEDIEAAALRDDEIGAAARHMLANPDLINYLDTGSNNIDYMDKVEEGRFHSTGGDGKISKEDIMAYVEKREVNRILQDVHSQIDIAANGGEADGVLSRNDYEAFVRSGQATEEQVLAIAIVLEDNAVDGEQGVGNYIADKANGIAAGAGYVALGAALVGLAATGVGTPAAIAIAGFAATTGTVATVVGTAASVTELTAGVVTHDQQHIASGGIGIVTGMVGSGTSGIIDETMEEGLKRVAVTTSADSVSFVLDQETGNLLDDHYNSETGASLDSVI